MRSVFTRGIVVTYKHDSIMTKNFTKAFITANRGCYSQAQLDACSFMSLPDNITTDNILDSEIPIIDKCFFIVKKLISNSEKAQLISQLTTDLLVGNDFDTFIKANPQINGGEYSQLPNCAISLLFIEQLINTGTSSALIIASIKTFITNN
jgi:hypothetical protein